MRKYLARALCRRYNPAKALVLWAPRRCRMDRRRRNTAGSWRRRTCRIGLALCGSWLIGHGALAQSGEGLTIRLTVSVGVGTLPDVAGSAEELIRAADQAMYRVKDSGKNGVFIARGLAAADGQGK